MKSYLAIVLLFAAKLAVVDVDATDPVVGGVGGLNMEATDAVKNMVKELQAEIKAAIIAFLPEGSPSLSGDIVAISYRRQTVNGVNYFVKVECQLGDKLTYFHIKLYEAIGKPSKFAGIQSGNKEKTDPITHLNFYLLTNEGVDSKPEGR